MMKLFFLNIILISFAVSVGTASRSFDSRSSAFAKASADKSIINQTVNRQPSTINCQLPTANRQPSTEFRSTTFSDLNRTAFYKAMESNNKTLVDAQISELSSAPANVKNAFLGAMTMKKAGIGGNPASKLKLFKQGHKLLEAAIAQDPDNTEFRFLRLIIQENAPGILGYKNDEEKDSEFIRKSYKSLPDDLQKTIENYNKKSKILKLQVS